MQDPAWYFMAKAFYGGEQWRWEGWVAQEREKTTHTQKTTKRSGRRKIIVIIMGEIVCLSPPLLILILPIVDVLGDVLSCFFNSCCLLAHLHPIRERPQTLLEKHFWERPCYAMETFLTFASREICHICRHARLPLECHICRKEQKKKCEMIWQKTPSRSVVFLDEKDVHFEKFLNILFTSLPPSKFKTRMFNIREHSLSIALSLLSPHDHQTPSSAICISSSLPLLWVFPVGIFVGSSRNPLLSFRTLDSFVVVSRQKPFSCISSLSHRRSSHEWRWRGESRCKCLFPVWVPLLPPTHILDSNMRWDASLLLTISSLMRKEWGQF